ncbi:helix-turn-helix domain-containing protein [Zunongwangia endophytica]|uniref:Helix-turn-helix domain-containing protein n=1 Tax=Zunongwangia endophytica TaxID=1808945 RepID=A0ABV8H6W6_9FLAO|nr:AraC family transcriptional regulator [Zunongwangia endophytica]MDN3595570.1 AraC family transcriptional regulator [Zunongwangia endophytica]
MQQSNYIRIARLQGVALNTLNAHIVNNKDEYKIIFVRQGNLSLRIGDKKWEASSKTILFLAPGQTSQITKFSDDLDGSQLIFDTDYFLLCLKNQVKLCFYPFFQFNSVPVLTLSKNEYLNLSSLLKRISYEVNNSESINDNLLCRLYLNVLLIEIERVKNSNDDDNHSPLSRKDMITARFKKLLEKNFKTIRKVSDYAEKLYISPTYLNDTVKEVTGKSASETIQERIILEIKGELIQTEDTINQIAYHLGFNDTSYFCRFFKKNTGVSPQIYRQSNH